MTVKGFITNLGKYNEGELVGMWIDFPVSADDLAEIFREIEMQYTDENGVVHNPYYEEYFFTDWEGVNLGEYISIAEVNTIAERMSNWDEETLEAIEELYGSDNVDLEHPEYYNLYPDISSDEDLGYYYPIEIGCLDIPDNIRNYFDFEAYGRDIRFETDGGFTSHGWLERTA